MTRPGIDWKGRCRRFSPIAPRPREGLLTEPTPAVRPWSRERVFMPHCCRSQRRRRVAELGNGVDAPRRHLRAKMTVSNCHRRRRPWSKLPRSVWTSRSTCSRCMERMLPDMCCSALRKRITRVRLLGFPAAQAGSRSERLAQAVNLNRFSVFFNR